jgi:hypothetical protein
MTLDSFLTKYLGKTKGYPDDTQFLGQCLSIVKLYIKECFGINPPPSGTNSAYGYWSLFPNPLGEVFEKVENTLDLIPEYGWIVIWKPWTSNPYGHIAIVDKGCTKTVLKNIAQNWTSKVFQRESQNYTNVVGFLRVKSLQEDMITEEQKRILQFLTEQGADEGKVREAFGALGDIPKLKTEIAELKKSLKDADKKVAELMEYIAEQDNVVKRLSEINETLSKDVKDGKEREDLLASEIGSLRLKVADLEKTIEYLNTPEPTANELEKDKNIFIKIWLLIKSLFK